MGFKKEFTIAEAAFLWFGINPKISKAEKQRLPDATKTKIKEMFSLLTEAGERKQITGITWEGPFPFPWSEVYTISRQGLRAYAEKLNQRPLFLFPEMRTLIEQGMSNDKQVKGIGFNHSPDFRSVNKDGKIFTLTSKQAQVIQKLWDAQEARTPNLGQEYIIETVSGATSTSRIRDYFKTNMEVWEALVEPGNKKGTFRLKK